MKRKSRTKLKFSDLREVTDPPSDLVTVQGKKIRPASFEALYSELAKRGDKNTPKIKAHVGMCVRDMDDGSDWLMTSKGWIRKPLFSLGDAAVDIRSIT